jgi:hypothetical protein
LPTESLWAHPDREAIGRILLAAATGEQIDPADRDTL